MLIDSHCHLDFNTFLGDQPEVIQRARSAGVEVMINAGDNLESSLNGLGLADTYEGIYCTFGVHPTEATKWDEDVRAAFLKKIALDRGRGKIVAIGETGLDFFRKGAERDVQEHVFREQIELAQEVNLPVVIHCRDAFPEVLAILVEKSVERVVFHCYTGDFKTAQRIWERGWLTSFTAIVSYPKNSELQRVVRSAPADLYTIETDAPFLPHQLIRGQRNEPAHVAKLARTVAELRNQDFSEVAEQTSANAIRFFGLQHS